MKIIPLIISLISICISVINYCNYKIQQDLIAIEIKESKEAQIKIYGFYSFLRNRRNEVYLERVKYEEQLGQSCDLRQKRACRVGIFTLKREEKLLRQLEERLREDNLV